MDSISKAAAEEEKTGRELLHHGDAVALSFSIQDQIASACHALRTSLELDDPVNARLLRAATGFASDVAIVYQQKEAEAVVEVMRAEAEAAAVAEKEKEEAEDAQAAAEEAEQEFEEKEGQEEIIEVDTEAEAEEGEERQEQDPAIQRQVAKETPAGSPVFIPGSQREPEVDEEKSTPTSEPPKELEEQPAVPAASCSNPLVAAIYRAAAQIQTDLLERVQLNSNSISALNTQSSDKIEYSCAWRAVNEALPVLVAKGMAACDAALKTAIPTAPICSNEDEVAELCRAFVDTLIRNLNE